MMIVIILVAFILICLIVILINQHLIMKSDKEFIKEIDRKIDRRMNQIDVDLYKRIQKKVDVD